MTTEIFSICLVHSCSFKDKYTLKDNLKKPRGVDKSKKTIVKDNSTREGHAFVIASECAVSAAENLFKILRIMFT